jgi:hypothetical protein
MMEAGRVDRLIATFGRGSNRRRAIGGFVVATAAALGEGAGATATQKKRCPKCTVCPQRACCSCRAVAQGPATTCFLLDGLGQGEAQSRCIAACGGPDLLFTVNTPIPEVANICAVDHTCAVKSCPIPV